jgi:hypothetical protein
MTNQQIIEYNARQITLMEHQIIFFRKKEIDANQFIHKIEALSSWIQNPPDNWFDNIMQSINRIEVIYSTALAHEEDLTNENLQKILQLVDKIEEQILWYKKNYLPPIDDENY